MGTRGCVSVVKLAHTERTHDLKSFVWRRESQKLTYFNLKVSSHETQGSSQSKSRNSLQEEVFVFFFLKTYSFYFMYMSVLPVWI